MDNRNTVISFNGENNNIWPMANTHTLTPVRTITLFKEKSPLCTLYGVSAEFPLNYNKKKIRLQTEQNKHPNLQQGAI